LNGDWIGKSAVAAFIAISCLLIGLEIHGNQPFKQQQIEQNPRYPQAQNERPEEPQIGVLATPTQSSHEAHYSRHASETRDGSSEKQDWIILGDGAAQWLMVLASIGALGVSIWAVCLLKETLKATRHTIRLGVKANAAAVKASEAANEANLIMREDQRPWVTLEPVYRCEFRDHDFRCEFYWNYQFANKGKTPAIHPELRWKMFKIDNLLEIQGLIEGYIDIQDWTYSNKRDILFAGEKTKMDNFACRYPLPKEFQPDRYWD